MFRRESEVIYCGLAALIFLVCVHSGASAQEYSQFCKKGGPTNSVVLLEVARVGRGMTWPLLPQLFLRIYDDGRIEYERLEGRKTVLRKGRLDSTVIEKFRKVIDAKDLAESQLEYPRLHTEMDASMRTCVSYSPRGGQTRQILIMNYAPNHPNAKDYYAPSLVELLSLVEKHRPANKDERKYRLDKLSFYHVSRN